MFNRRIEEVITRTFDDNKLACDDRQSLQSSDDGLLMEFKFASISWTPHKDTVTDLETSNERSLAVIQGFSGQFMQGEHVAVIGRVGAGKTSLLLAILGEVPISEGSLLLKPGISVSYAGQEPLIVTGTIQENITFGSELDLYWYNTILEACCLKEDLIKMPAGD